MSVSLQRLGLTLADAGEVADQFPRQKNITIVSSGSTLVGGPFPAKLGRSLATQLEQRGVKIIYNVR